jgi:hypothetical protein
MRSHLSPQQGSTDPNSIVFLIRGRALHQQIGLGNVEYTGQILRCHTGQQALKREISSSCVRIYQVEPKWWALVAYW